MLKLVKVAEEYLPAVIEAVAEYKVDPNPYKVAGINELIAAVEENKTAAWLQTQHNNALGINLKPNHVASTAYWLLDGEKYIGSFVLRHKLTENLRQIGGHIAYIIRPSARGHGYGSAGLTLCLQEARQMGLEQVLITCKAQNAASFAVMRKAMHKYGGEMLPDVMLDEGKGHRVWVNTPPEVRFCLPVGQYGFLSPLAEWPIKMAVDGRAYVFPSVEHYYQAMKFYADDPRFQTILGLKNPDDARLLTKTPAYKTNRRADFAKNKFAIMEAGLRAKFAQHTAAAKMLQQTGDAVLIKACAVCYKCGFGIGGGENRLGKMLMQIRQELSLQA